MAERTNVVVVGYGMGAHHAKLINEVAGLNLLGVCDMDADKRERAAREHEGIRTYSAYEDALNDPDAQVIVIVTPHNVHAEMAIAAMDSGKHAITDKAMCLNVAEARNMIAARDRNDVLLSTFHNRRWDSEFITVRKIVEEGLIGKLYHIESNVTYYGKPGGWRADRAAMGGWLFDWGAHTLDQILILAQSRPKHVYAFLHHRFDEPASVEDYINCNITFESGLTASTVIGYLNKIEMPRWYVMGGTGTLQADNFDRPVRVRTSLQGLEGDVTIPLTKGEWKSYYQNIADTLDGKAELYVKPEELVPQIAIAEAAYKSIATEQVVPVTY